MVKFRRYYYDFANEWRTEPLFLRLLHAIPVVICGTVVAALGLVLSIVAIAALVVLACIGLVVFLAWKVLELPYAITRMIFYSIDSGKHGKTVEVIIPEDESEKGED